MKDVREHILRKYFYGWSHGDLTGDYIEDTIVGAWMENDQSDLVPPPVDENTGKFVNKCKEVE